MRMKGVLNRVHQTTILNHLIKNSVSSYRVPQRFQNSIASKNIFSPTVFDHGTRLEVKTVSWPHSINFSYLWLRDHCKCPKCYHTGTSQRLLDLYTLSKSIRPTSVEHTDEGITLNWPDGHSSCFSYKFLWQNSLEGSRKPIQKVTWNKKRFPDLSEISVPAAQFETKEGSKQIYKNILTYGAAIISQSPHTVEGTEKILGQFGQIMETFYGKVSVFGNDNAYSDLAYSNVALGAHTDGTYFSESPRIQSFHVLKASEIGGETLLVDGFDVAAQLKKSSPEGYDFLTKFHTPSEYVGDEVHCKHTGPIFRHSPITKRLEQFRYNIYDRASLNTLDYKYIDEYYSHLMDLTKIIRDDRNEVWIKLGPGQILLFDNWRVMHGRASFEGSRQIASCYHGNTEFMSKARTLGLDV